jgi:alpha-galactosidase
MNAISRGLMVAAAGAILAVCPASAADTADMPREEPVLLTPKPGPAPRINGAKVYGCRPGNPFLYRIPTTGERPMGFVAEGLPEGLTLDASSGIITGTAPPRGEYAVTLRAKNRHGQASRSWKIVCGNMLALTPPMGWNHWYAHYNRITDQIMRQAADAMVQSGMADVGYQYVSIDDCWMNAPPDAKHNKDPQRVGPLRNPQGNILPNKYFPDMKALTDSIHAKGLKAGIYTSPGPLTCAGFAGSYQHEAQDAQQFADWGFDFLKYDWCSYSRIAGNDKSLEALQKPYRLMGELLKRQPRDIVLNLCQYGRGNVWEWGAEVGGHCWRTAGDLGFALDRIFDVALKNAEHRAWSKPGAWNDPDYIQIGCVGNARGLGEPSPCPLGPSEQYAFMSMWCLMAAPLFYSGDMSRLDDFTLNVLCNPEVIAVDQDSLGQCARVVPLTEDTFLMVKQMDDGSKAAGLGNRGQQQAAVTAKWSDLGISGKHVVRDLWRQQDLGTVDGQWSATVPRHGMVLVRVRRAEKD